MKGVRNMTYGRIPLYPALCPGGEGSACVTMPLFDDGRGGPPGPSPCGDVQRVTIENPCRPGEWAEVLLGVDGCGNLTVCVRRAAECCRRPEKPCRPCPPPCPRPRRCGRLYGNWEN